jgi:hypothetical protein
MFIRKTLFGVVAVAGLALGTTANAAGYVSGSVSIIGFFGVMFPPGTSIVSQLTTIVPSVGLVTAGAGFDDYAGSSGPVAAETILLDPLAPGYPGVQPAYTFADGTEFYAVLGDSIVRNALDCDGSSCSDSLTFRLIGTVKRSGFLDTPALLRWTGQGSCVGTDVGLAVCTGQPSASWSASLSSPAIIPEPAMLGLLGLGLVGIAVWRRKRA